jgi:hypothetical protein
MNCLHIFLCKKVGIPKQIEQKKFASEKNMVHVKEMLRWMKKS